MSDIVDFSPQPDPDRPARRRPAWLSGGMALPLAAAGAASAVASLFAEWQTVRVPEGGTGVEEYSSSVSALGPLGTAYLVTLVGLVTAAALTLFADHQVRGVARVIGLALSGSALALLGAAASVLTRTAEIAEYRFFPPEMMSNVNLTLEWGLFAAMGGVSAIGAAMILHRPAAISAEPIEEPEWEDDNAIDLTVSVAPIGKPAGT